MPRFLALTAGNLTDWSAGLRVLLSRTKDRNNLINMINMCMWLRSKREQTMERSSCTALNSTKYEGHSGIK